MFHRHDRPFVNVSLQFPFSLLYIFYLVENNGKH